MVAISNADFGTLLKTQKFSYASEKSEGAQLGEFAIGVIGQILSGVLSAENDKNAANDADKETTSLEKAHELTQKTTTEALKKYAEIIGTKADIINENLKKIEDANKEKQEIQEELDKQLKIIEEATAYLNGETSSDNNSGENAPKDRADAISKIKAAGGVIGGLVTRSTELAKKVEAGQKEISTAQSDILSTKTDMDTKVEQAANELQAQTTKSTTEENRNNQNNSTGTTHIAKGDAKIAEAEAASTFGGLGAAAAEQLRRDGEQLKEGGTTLTKSAGNNLPKLSKIKGAIKSNLTQFTADYNNIGNAANIALGTATTSLSSWGEIGGWSTEFTDTAKGESEKILEEADKVDPSDSNVTTENTENETNENPNNEANNNDKKRTFDYDTSTLRKLVGEKK